MGFDGKYAGLFDWLYNMGGFSLYFLTPLPMLLSSLWIISERKKALASPGGLMTLCLFAFGLLHVVVFNQGAYYHEFWIWYLAPAVSLSSAIYLNRLEPRFFKRHLILIGVSVAIAFTAAHILYVPVKRYSWVLLHFLFSALPLIVVLLISTAKAKRFKEDLIVLVLSFYVILSTLQVIWDRYYWRTDESRVVGYYIKEHSSPPETILGSTILTPIAFYSDRPRRVVYTLEEFKECMADTGHRYSFFVISYRSKDNSKEVLDYLLKHYPVRRLRDCLLFDLRPGPGGAGERS